MECSSRSRFYFYFKIFIFFYLNSSKFISKNPKKKIKKVDVLNKVYFSLMKLSFQL